MEATKGFGLAYKVPADTLEQLGRFGIDLEKASGEDHHLLPVPAVFLLDQKARITFEYVNPDYKVRIPARLVLEAAQIF